MASMTTVVGNVVNDIELRFTQSGKAVANVTVAVNDKKFNRQTNTYEDGPTWFARGTLWGELAEHVHQSVGKGARVIGYGRIVQRDFETKAGEKRSAVEVEFDAFGPDLRFATANVTRTNAGAAQNASFGGGTGQQWGNTQPAPSQAVTNDSGFGNGFDDEQQPF